MRALAILLFLAPVIAGNDDVVPTDFYNDSVDDAATKSLELMDAKADSLIQIDTYITTIEERLNVIELAYLHHERPDQYDNPYRFLIDTTTLFYRKRALEGALAALRDFNLKQWTDL